jgi:D-aminoacyl-tRNA deacylase
MKAVIQRVSGAAVASDGETVGEIGEGLFVLLGVANGDTPQCAEKLASKIVKMRIFSDKDNDNGKEKLMKSVADVGGGVLIVSNFTLCGSCAKGNRPDFTGAAAASTARGLYLHFIDEIIKAGVKTCASGRFGAEMLISARCDGPVTIVLDTDSFYTYSD